MWLFYALLAGGFYTVQGLLTRHLLRGQKDSWAFSFYFSFIGALVSLPFMLYNPVLPSSWQPWLLAPIVGIFVVSQNLLNFKAYNYVEASLLGAISKFRLVWVFVFGITLAQTSFSWPVFIGMLLTIGASLIIMHHFKQPKSLIGIWMALAATVFYAAAIVTYEHLFAHFNAVSLTFFVVFLPAAIINFILMPQAWQRITRLFKDSGKAVVLACGFGAFGNLALLQGLAEGQATAVLVTIEAFLVLTLVGEHIFLKEKDKPLIKLASVLLAIAGAILIRLSS